MTFRQKLTDFLLDLGCVIQITQYFILTYNLHIYIL